MNRPTGVTIVAILHFIGACFLALAAIAIMLGGGMIAAMLGPQSNPGLAAGLASMGVAIGVFCLLLAAGVAFIGYGNWTLKPWARTLTIVLSALGLVAGALLLLTSALHVNIGLMISAILRLAINAIIIWYYLQPSVKNAFGAA